MHKLIEILKRLFRSQPYCFVCNADKDFWDKPCHVCIGRMVEEYRNSPAGKAWAKEQANLMSTNTFGKYRKKPVVIEAVQYDGSAPARSWISRWADSHGTSITNIDGRLVIPTLEGNMEISPGDFVIRGIQNEFYPCKREIFEATYDFAGKADHAKTAEDTISGSNSL